MLLKEYAKKTNWLYLDRISQVDRAMVKNAKRGCVEVGRDFWGNPMIVDLIKEGKKHLKELGDILVQEEIVYFEEGMTTPSSQITITK